MKNKTLKDRLDGFILDDNDKPIMVYKDDQLSFGPEISCPKCGLLGKKVKQPDVKLTVRMAILKALGASFEEDKKDKDVKKFMERGELLMKIKKFNLGSKLNASDEIPMIFERVKQHWNSAYVIIQVKNAIDGVE